MSDEAREVDYSYACIAMATIFVIGFVTLLILSLGIAFLWMVFT